MFIDLRWKFIDIYLPWSGWVEHEDTVKWFEAYLTRNSRYALYCTYDNLQLGRINSGVVLSTNEPVYTSLRDIWLS